MRLCAKPGRGQRGPDLAGGGAAGPGDAGSFGLQIVAIEMGQFDARAGKGQAGILPFRHQMAAGPGAAQHMNAVIIATDPDTGKGKQIADQMLASPRALAITKPVETFEEFFPLRLVYSRAAVLHAQHDGIRLSL